MSLWVLHEHRCVYCARSVFSQTSKDPSPSGVPDRAWVIKSVMSNSRHLDEEISFGPTGTVRLCPACRDWALAEMKAEVVIDDRSGETKILMSK